MGHMKNYFKSNSTFLFFPPYEFPGINMDFFFSKLVELFSTVLTFLQNIKETEYVLEAFPNQVFVFAQ